MEGEKQEVMSTDSSSKEFSVKESATCRSVWSGNVIQENFLKEKVITYF